MNPSLDQLRDIQLPAPVSWWPPAPGWWCLLLGAMLLLMGAGWWLRRRLSNRWRRQALDELTRMRALLQSGRSGSQDCVKSLSVLLRRVAISRFPNARAASLHGDAWLAFLDETLGEGSIFRSDDGRMLAIAPYTQDAHIEAANLQNLFAWSERWIRKLPSGAKK